MKKYKFLKTAVLKWKDVRQSILEDIQGREVTADIDADAPLLYDINVLITTGKDINNSVKFDMYNLREQLHEQDYEYFMIIAMK